ncbi:Lipoprotein NosD family [Halanaeroarchaeum sp. HSR-CO]|uniref:right-handed parallel beta-helix repeat-containing protein n=1 Tax=Halanaeroarchaeum sp. HSR-CO TaxID=2866382 RepID=UPI00217F0897|nr:right-handed parallel beta-helix repeat-containing protein [Halanaeroarchaeum sp. HSR-CO]UWG46872.1 Lipoprotein NosD family [Halanaeroarchaeum sp. HSR-CO]
MQPVNRRLLTVVLLVGVVTAAAAGMTAVAGADDGADVTFIEGDVTGDTTWTPEAGPYRVIRDVDVQDGATLTVEPGTEVQVADGRTITVAGSLVANGTVASPVTIRMTPGASTAARWSTLRYEGAADSTLSLSNTTVQDARVGITVASDAGDLSIHDVTVRNVANHGLAVTDVTSIPEVDVEDSTFANVGGHGIAATPASGSLEAISLGTSSNVVGERARHTLTLEPGVEVTTNELRLSYGEHGDVSSVDAGAIQRFGVDTDEDGAIERSLTQHVGAVTATDGRIAIDLSRAVTIEGDERLVLAVDGVGNPETRGIYRVDVAADRDGVSQLADGVHAPLTIGGISSDHADTDVVTPTAVESLSVRETTFEGIGGAGVRVDADELSRLRLANNRFDAVDGAGVHLRGRTIDARLHGNQISAGDAGIRVAVRDRLGHLTVASNAVTESESGLAIRQSGSRARASLGMTVERNEFADNDRYGIDVDADRGRLSGGSVSSNELVTNGEGGIRLATDGIHGVTVADNRIADNDGDGLWVRTRRLESVSIAETAVSGNAGDGLAIRTYASARDLSIRNTTVVDNGGHGVSVRTDLVAHGLTVADSQFANNAGAGIAVTSPLTHGGSVDVTESVVAANNYGIHVAGALRANVSENDIVYNTNAHASAVPLDDVEPGTAISVTEGSAGVVVDRGGSHVSLDDLVSDPRIDVQLASVGPNPEIAVVLRTDGQGHTRYQEAAALPVASILGDIPTGVALSTRETAGVTLAENDVYDHPRGLTVDVAPLIDTNTTARLLVENVRTVSAERTYWGAETGPFHDSILPSGTGDPIVTRAGWVDFVPYATEANGDRYERPQPALSAPAEAVPNETVTLDGSRSTAPNGTIARYHFVVDGTARSRPAATHSFTMPESAVTTRLAVEDELGIDSEGAATVTVEPVEPEETTTATTAPVTTTGQPEPEDSGLLGTVLAVLGGLSYLVGVVLGTYGMWLTLRQRNPPYDGRIVHGFAIGGVVIWAVGGLIVGDGLWRLAVAAGAFWTLATAIAYVLASR